MNRAHEFINIAKPYSKASKVISSALGGSITNNIQENMPTALIIGLAMINIIIWVLAWITFREHPALLGMALVSWGLGLRHALDVDHIVAIDNVTRNMMERGKRPATLGLFFSLGHSTVVVIAVLADDDHGELYLVPVVVQSNRPDLGDFVSTGVYVPHHEHRETGATEIAKTWKQM